MINKIRLYILIFLVFLLYNYIHTWVFNDIRKKYELEGIGIPIHANDIHSTSDSVVSDDILLINSNN